MIILTCEQGSEDWLRARAGVITASRFRDARSKTGGLDERQQAYIDAIRSGVPEPVARAQAGYKSTPRSDLISRAIAGEDVTRPTADAIRYAWLVALETVAREPLDDTFTTYAMRRGQELEPHAKRVYERRTGAWLEDVSLILTDDERFGYSADAFRDDDGLIEVKCPMSPDKIGEVWASPDTAHLEYIDQIDGGLWITGRRYCDLVIYCPWLAPVGKDLFIKRIFRDEGRIEALEHDLMAFMRLVDANVEVLRKPTKMSGASLGEEAATAASTPPWAVDKPTADAVEAVTPQPASTATTPPPAARVLAPTF